MSYGAMVLCGVVVDFCILCIPVREAIIIPSSVPFSISIENCSRPFLGSLTCPLDKLIGVFDNVDKMVWLLLKELGMTTEGGQRARPLMISRLARGGKTTTLSLLFDKLQMIGVRVISITFNGSCNFQSRPGETQRNAILRVIATQLVDIGNLDPRNIECDEHALDEYIGALPFMLLIDDLNSLAAPLDAEAGSMLRRLFLDKHNRCLVFTTHVPMSLEPQASQCMMPSSTPASPHGCLTVPIPLCVNLNSLRNMSVQCESLTPAEVMLYGGIPSLIYSVKAMHEMKPDVRFAKKISSRSCRDQNMLKSFILSVVDGERRSNIAIFDEFSVVPEEDKIRWPLCYIALILKLFHENEASHAVCDNCDSLSTYAQTTESGKEWECVINIAIIFRCLYQSFSAGGSPFSIVPSGIKPTVICRTLPSEYNKSFSVKGFIERYFKSSSSFPCVLVLVPSYFKFPEMDGFVVYWDHTAQPLIYGYQAKTSRRCPIRRCPDWMEKGFLVRVRSPSKGSLRNGWNYMSEEDVLSLLGYSLLPMYPDSWPEYPHAEAFD